MNEHQTKVIRRMMEEGAKGFAGGMNAGGRSTKYQVNL